MSKESSATCKLLDVVVLTCGLKLLPLVDIWRVVTVDKEWNSGIPKEIDDNMLDYSYKEFIRNNDLWGVDTYLCINNRNDMVQRAVLTGGIVIDIINGILGPIIGKDIDIFVKAKRSTYGFSNENIHQELNNRRDTHTEEWIQERRFFDFLKVMGEVYNKCDIPTFGRMLLWAHPGIRDKLLQYPDYLIAPDIDIVGDIRDAYIVFTKPLTPEVRAQHEVVHSFFFFFLNLHSLALTEGGTITTSLLPLNSYSLG